MTTDTPYAYFTLGAALGAALGSICTAIFMKNKYEKELRKELDDFKSQYADEVKKYSDTVERIASKEKHDLENREIANTSYESFDTADHESDISIESSEDLDAPSDAKEFKDISYKPRKVDEYKDYSKTERSSNIRNEINKAIDGSNSDGPYIITPDQLGEKDNYDIITLYYYSDNVLATETGNIVDDINWTIGEDALEYIGKYEDGAITVRNDRLKCDYEIFEDLRTYSDIKSKQNVK